ncbi:VOC family protein (plasmid) [Rhizobium sp. CC1099]|uniref:VOC family protein n=1 Tax=Rhizobium sp. CC1099 TaxID=3039160 RepID=UPI0024B1C0C1|nr:VOC family protein [Rhizobium sp. CC1099]WFU90490.1 VOC family protein [Rhizobium sp. CC1099]
MRSYERNQPTKQAFQRMALRIADTELISMISITGLYESHLTVSDLDRSIDFYRDVVGLELAHTIPDRHVVFFWVGGRDRSMLGLWSIHRSPINTRMHVAFQTTLDQIIRSPQYLRSKGVKRSEELTPWAKRRFDPLH